MAKDERSDPTEGRATAIELLRDASPSVSAGNGAGA